MAVVAEWVEDEMKTLDLGDTRRDDRLKEVLGALAAQPCASIPAAMKGGRAETEAAYRLFENDHFGFEEMLNPHCEATLQRIAAEMVVIIAQDTTEIQLTRPQTQVAGAGPLDEGARRGCLLHVQHVFTPELVPLGSIAAETWVRQEAPRTRAAKATAAERRQERLQTPIEEKESHRWVEGVRFAHRIAGLTPGTEIVSVSDSEADIYELLVAAQLPELATESETCATESETCVADGQTAFPPRAQWIVRGCQDRALLRDLSSQASADNDGGTPSDVALRTVLEQVAAAPVRKTYEVKVRGRDPKVCCETRGRRQARESRTATVELRACPVTLRAPHRHDRKLPAVRLNLVLVREVNPPRGEQPIEWLLLTSLPIRTADESLRVVTLYACRWQIEVYFRVLKQGCRIEARRFETIDNLWRYLAVAMIISWRTLYVMRLGRESPDLSCEAVFDVSEWKAVYQVTQRKFPPRTPPRLGDFVRMVGQLGGFVNRGKGAMPGAETIWKGLQRMHDMALCWDAFGPDSSH